MWAGISWFLLCSSALAALRAPLVQSIRYAPRVRPPVRRVRRHAGVVVRASHQKLRVRRISRPPRSLMSFLASCSRSCCAPCVLVSFLLAASCFLLIVLPFCSLSSWCTAPRFNTGTLRPPHLYTNI